ncbi:hypothetical protein OG905_08895 [Streptomyces sp. NBC_00322]|uniref:hypothetical protein n=1 Tax=Streptomyces sp. NBC_00322 TaxID=2975712 RepID=UPI002E2CAB0B|nr:hypothetical protein [Streptomyces sp. NBC_00322]
MNPTTLTLHMSVDLAHGGRWTSLRGGSREWLWQREDPRRHQVRPGDAFVDAGGLEECIPTVRGAPDHGHAWSRPWRQIGDTAVVDCPEFVLTRSISHNDGALVADYRLAAAPGYRFVWAAHALLEVSAAARLSAPAGTPVRLCPEAEALLDVPWPTGAPWLEGQWPAPHGLALDRLGPDDGTAIGAVLADCAQVQVVDGSDTLNMRVEADGQPTSVGLWRNLGGFPPSGPYRSIGVEPMLGAVFNLADARPADAAVVPACGELVWRLVLTATRTRP